jgi:hypothetical protein
LDDLDDISGQDRLDTKFTHRSDGCVCRQVQHEHGEHQLLSSKHVADDSSLFSDEWLNREFAIANCRQSEGRNV